MRVTLGLHRAALVRGDAAAVLDQSVRYTWRECRSRVARLAAGLQQLGVRRGDRVAILMLNGHRYLELYYAVPWAGGIVMPLNTRLVAPELLAQLQNGEPTVLVVDATFAGMAASLAPASSSIRVVVNASATAARGEMVAYEPLIEQSAPAADAEIGGDEVYGIFYTGGTTAGSRGVMLSHTNICVNAYNVTACMGYGPRDVYLHAAPMFHLADSASTFAVTTAGGGHAFIPSFSPEELSRAVQRYGVTSTLLVPTMINALVNWPGLAEADLSSWRIMLYGASPISPALIATALQRLPCRLAQGYGLTETSPTLTCLPPDDHVIDGPLSHRLRSAGIPVPNTELYVVDAAGNRLPPGSVGEVVARGPQVMKGYWRNDAGTAAAITPDGFLHTGDVGYLDEQGYLFLIDRAKDMIVTGGENVYSVEVERAIMSHPAVQEAAVFGIPDDTLGEVVHAVVVLKPGAAAIPDELASHCRAQIAGYKVPRTMTFSSDPLPRSSTGKILRRPLRAPFWEGQEREIH